MAKALFVFDHKYPCDDHGNCYYSSGFDQEFFRRYYSIFEQFDIFGRLRNVSTLDSNDIIEFPTKFYLVSSNKKIISSGALKKLKEAILSVDCVIARMPSIFGMLAIRLSKKYKKPYIVEVVACTYDALSSSPSLKRRLLARPAEFIYRKSLQHNPYTIYVTKKFLQNKYPCDGKTIDCSNVTLPCVTEEALSDRKNKISSFSLNKKIVIGTTSTLNVDFKGQKYVIQAIPELLKNGINIEYQLVGDGDASWLLNLAKSLNVEKNVKILGRLDHDAVFQWLDTIDIYVHPSCQEGLSRAIIEAMSRACPIIAANSGGIHELIDEKYITPIKNSSAIVEKLLEIMDGEMLEQAIKNHSNAKNYIIPLLYKRREDFYNLFMKESGINE